jgi:predicted DNA-binding transcriptional regulator AlpA
MPNLPHSKTVSNAPATDTHNDIPENRFLRRQTVAERLGCSVWTPTRMWARGEGPQRRKLSPKYDGCTEADLAAYFDQCKV